MRAVCQICLVAATICFVTASAPTSSTESPFRFGALVVVTLSSPREKFWGAILSLKPEGVSVAGVDLASFDEFLHLLKAGEACSPRIVFFPMHRVERLELDLPEGDVPSLSQRLAAKTGLEVQQVLSTRENA
jgi:hypothetical protein